MAGTWEDTKDREDYEVAQGWEMFLWSCLDVNGTKMVGLCHGKSQLEMDKN